MGIRLQNFSISCDYATPEKHTALTLHMELPIPHEDIQKVQEWLENRHWKAGEVYLVDKYPQHRTLISEWLRASQARSEGDKVPMSLVA